MNLHHKKILSEIKSKEGEPTQHTFVNAYLGTAHTRYPINNPVMRSIAKNWMKQHSDMGAKEVAKVITSLMYGKSFTEKCIGGFILDYATSEQRKFDPSFFEEWINQLEGWAEVDTLCTGKYSGKEISIQWKKWKPLLVRFSKSKNIHHRRASLVLLCAPLRKPDEFALAEVAFKNIHTLKNEKEILITKAVSWLLRSMVKNYRADVIAFMKKEIDLPAIAVRETKKVLKTGKKSR